MLIRIFEGYLNIFSSVYELVLPAILYVNIIRCNYTNIHSEIIIIFNFNYTEY